MKKLFLKIRFNLVTKFLNKLYRKERADMLLYMEKSDDYPISNQNSVDETIAYCQSLSLKKVKAIRNESSAYWDKLDSLNYAERLEQVKFALPKGFDSVFVVSVSRKLDDPNTLGVHTVITDKGNYIPVPTEQIASSILGVARELLEEQLNIEKMANGN